MILSIAYSASIGGAGTLIGSGSPLAFKGILEEYISQFFTLIMLPIS
jgi:Na+/H+ antiporter NhaD/arsenite permease-like protein